MEAVDDDFLSKVEEAEAIAKRRKMMSTASTGEVEGSYMAALKGSKSLLWQQTAMKNGLSPRPGVKAKASDSFSVPADANSCFKCGKPGHWARDCVGSGSTDDDGSRNPPVAEKPCHCGAGACLVLTANTEKNRGRKFYRCPNREENGGCGFFEWCDISSGSPAFKGAPLNNAFSSLVPDLPCQCGAGVCLVLTAKTEKNMGQQFYRCPASQGGSCGFFKWCNDHSPAVGPPSSGRRVDSTLNDVNSQSYGARSSSCFKCGQEGHWARDCPKLLTDSSLDVGGRSDSSNGCYKCGKAGHWARDCPSQEPSVTTGGRKTSSFRSSHGNACE